MTEAPQWFRIMFTVAAESLAEDLGYQFPVPSGADQVGMAQDRASQLWHILESHGVADPDREY